MIKLFLKNKYLFYIIIMGMMLSHALSKTAKLADDVYTFFVLTFFIFWRITMIWSFGLILILGFCFGWLFSKIKVRLKLSCKSVGQGRGSLEGTVRPSQLKALSLLHRKILANSKTCYGEGKALSEVFFFV